MADKVVAAATKVAAAAASSITSPPAPLKLSLTHLPSPAGKTTPQVLYLHNHTFTYN